MVTAKRLMVTLLLMVVLAGCSSGGSDDSDSAGQSSAGAYSSNKATVTSGGEMSSVSFADSEGESEASIAIAQDSASIIGTEQASAFNRKIIYTANIVMQVKDYHAAQSDIRDLIMLSKGYMLNFQEASNERENNGTLTFKIPADHFEPFIDQLQKLEPLKFQQNVEGKDVTEDYVDFTSRLKAKQVVEERLLSFMEKAETSSDLLAFSNELGRVQESIEQLKGHLRYLEQNVAYSTVTIRLSERLDGRILSAYPSFYERIDQALKGSLTGISHVMQGLVVFIVWAIPVLIVIFIFAIPIWYLIRKIIKRAWIKSNLKSVGMKDEENQD